jgi:acetoin utilization protein AcuB
MTSPALFVDIEDRLDVVMAVMERARVRHLLVFSGGRLRGVLSQRDALAASRRRGDHQQRARHDHAITAGSLMSAAPLVAHAGESIGDAADRMLAEHISCLPVVDGEEVVGIVTSSDLIRLAVRRLDAAAAAGRPSVMVAQLMTPAPIVAVAPDDPLAEAARLLERAGCRHLAVVDKEELVGLLSDRDLLSAQGDYDPKVTRCGELMSTPPSCVWPWLDAARAGEQLLERHIGALPVVDDRGVVGMLSEIDLLAYVAATSPPDDRSA